MERNVSKMKVYYVTLSGIAISDGMISREEAEGFRETLENLGYMEIKIEEREVKS